jgi:regulator of RNase E activity RraA
MDDATHRRLLHASTATLTTQLIKRGFANCFIPGQIALHAHLRMVGTAFTLRYVPTRADMDMSVEYDNDTNVQRLAVESISPGQVLVIDAREDVRAASFGHIIATRIMRRGAAGLVTDGALRDAHRIRELQLPTYCRAVHATTSSLIHHPVEMNVPIGCGGVLVVPDDVVVGDAEGVVVMPAAVADEVAAAAYEQERLEDFIWTKVNAGESIRGVYPPDSKTRAEFEAARQANGD